MVESPVKSFEAGPCLARTEKYQGMVSSHMLNRFDWMPVFTRESRGLSYIIPFILLQWS